MSAANKPGFTPAIQNGLNSRYRLGEHDLLLAEADAHQDWFDRINKHTQSYQRLNGMYIEFSPVTRDQNPRSSGIVIDEQHVFNLEDLR